MLAVSEDYGLIESRDSGRIQSLEAHGRNVNDPLRSEEVGALAPGTQNPHAGDTKLLFVNHVAWLPLFEGVTRFVEPPRNSGTLYPRIGTNAKVVILFRRCGVYSTTLIEGE